MKEGYVYIADNVFSTLFAISDSEQSQGLMYQKWPPPTMSFIYGSPRINKFWMQNTECPLDIIFCLNGKVNQICEGKPYSTATIGNDCMSDLIIELPRGSASFFNIRLGDRAGVGSDNLREINKLINKKYSSGIII